VPTAEAYAHTLYRYDANAEDPDNDPLTFTSVVETTREQVDIDNPGFEDQELYDGGYLIGDLTGWTITDPGTAGPFNPTAIQYPGDVVPEGQNVAYSDGPTLSQTLSATLSSHTSYILQVEVGRRTDFPFPGYVVQLWAGDTLLAEDTSLTPPRGSFVTSTVQYHAAAGNPWLGQPLEIRLLSTGSQVNFDNVRLEAVTAVTPDGMTMDTDTGIVEWTPGTGQIGRHELTITAADSHGATTAQSYCLVVGGEPDNHRPIIISPLRQDLWVRSKWPVSTRETRMGSLRVTSMPATARTVRSCESPTAGPPSLTHGWICRERPMGSSADCTSTRRAFSRAT
jgi:hypothetical protein